MNLSTYLDRIEALSIREQVLIAATVTIFIASMAQLVLIDPSLDQRDVLQGRLTSILSGNARLQQQLDGEALMPNQNRQVVLAQELANLDQQILKSEKQLEAGTASLVPAGEIPELLQRLLSERSIELLSLRNLAPVAVLDPEDAGGAPTVQLYRHGLELELKGSYHGLRRYLMAVESQPWQLIWQAVDLRSGTDGESIMKLRVNTLSTDDVWIGV